MSELIGVMLVDSLFSVTPEAAVNYNANKRESVVMLSMEENTITWRVMVVAFEKLLTAARCQYLPALSVPEGQPPSPVTIDTAIAQAYDAFCLQCDLWRRASHIEWLPVLPMSLGVEPGQRSGTWKFSASPAPKATTPVEGRKQKQDGKNRNDSPARKAGASKRSKRG